MCVYFFRLNAVAPVVLRPSNLTELLASSGSTIEPRFAVVIERNPTLFNFVVSVEGVKFAHDVTSGYDASKDDRMATMACAHAHHVLMHPSHARAPVPMRMARAYGNR